MQLALELLESLFAVEEHQALQVDIQQNRPEVEQEALLPLAAYLGAEKYAKICTNLTMQIYAVIEICKNMQ